MSRRAHHPEAVEVVEVLAWIPVTPRKGWRVARIRQSGVEFAELRACGLDPAWRPSPSDHRSAVRGAALRRIIAGLQAVEAKIGGKS